MCILAFFDKHPWFATFFTILSTVGLAVWQINRQFRNTIASQRANKLEELRVQIYKEIAEKIEACQTALSKSNTTAIVPLLHLKESLSKTIKQGLQAFQSRVLLSYNGIRV